MKKVTGVISGLLAVGLFSLVGCGADSGADPSDRTNGHLTFYSGPNDAKAQALADGFKKAHGIDASFLRLSGSKLSQRYSAEADANAVVADAIVAGDGDVFIADAVRNGWMTPLEELGLGGWDGFPKEFKTEHSAVIHMIPHGICYNPSALGDAPKPESWEDLADPRFKEKILLVDPGLVPSITSTWAGLADEYGDEFMSSIAANVGRTFDGTTPAGEALAAGEGAVVVMCLPDVAANLKDAGAEVEFLLPEFSGATPILLGITAAGPNHNAARVFAEYAISPEGTRAFAGQDDVTPYDEEAQKLTIHKRLSAGETSRILAYFGR